MRPELLLASLLIFAAASAQAQWQILDAPTTASLRGVDNVGKGIVWASGTEGTILRSTDDGATWTRCTTPPAADKLDFRGIQAFDANTAIVMSSGKGDLSRLYKTTDGCTTWKLVFTDPDADGFFDALAVAGANGAVLGDPVGGCFRVWRTKDAGAHWANPPRTEELCPQARKDDAAFAASNSSFALLGQDQFVTGGTEPAILQMDLLDKWKSRWLRQRLPIAAGTPSTGAFSIAYGGDCNAPGGLQGLTDCFVPANGVIVGGDYLKPDQRAGNSAYSLDAGQDWFAAKAPPHGYRSAVAYDTPTRTWITVGPNGTDISTDDGRNWQALRPDAKAGDPPDADQNWNALSLPFVVGPHGRIGKLRDDALKPAAAPTRH